MSTHFIGVFCPGEAPPLSCGCGTVWSRRRESGEYVPAWCVRGLPVRGAGQRSVPASFRHSSTGSRQRGRGWLGGLQLEHICVRANHGWVGEGLVPTPSGVVGDGVPTAVRV